MTSSRYEQRWHKYIHWWIWSFPVGGPLCVDSSSDIISILHSSSLERPVPLTEGDTWLVHVVLSKSHVTPIASCSARFSPLLFIISDIFNIEPVHGGLLSVLDWIFIYSQSVTGSCSMSHWINNDLTNGCPQFLQAPPTVCPSSKSDCGTFSWNKHVNVQLGKDKTLLFCIDTILNCDWSVRRLQQITIKKNNKQKES